jgi:spermidine synthase
MQVSYQTFSPRILAFLLAFCMFSTGASGLVNEYILATMTTYILGNSIEQFSLVIAMMMLMMGVSGLVQERMSDNNLMRKFLAVEVLMAILGSYAPLLIYAAYAYSENHFLFIQYSLVLMIGFLIGFEIPIVMRIIAQHKIKLKTNLAIVYAMDYIGAFIGAVIWVKFLLKHYPLTEISFIVAGFNFFIAAIAVLYFLFHRLLKPFIVIFIIILITSALLIYGYLQNRDFSQLLEQQFYDDPIVNKVTTKYQHLVVTKNKITNDIRLYINGNTQFSSLDEQRYHDLLVHPPMAIQPAAEKVLILGGGDGLALREVLKYSRVKQVTLVDLDPGMVNLARHDPHLKAINHNAFSDARVYLQYPNNHPEPDVQSVYLNSGYVNDEDQQVALVDVFHVDADRFIENKKQQKWDIVIIDLPDPSSVELAKLYSKRFYLRLKQHLSDQAFIAIQSTSPFHAKEAFLTIGRTLESVGFKTIPYRQNIPSFGDWGYFLAWNHATAESVVKARINNIQKFEVETAFITPELMRASLAFGKSELISEENCINTILFPCLLTQYTDYSWLVE